ncbi:MAG: hypothetical protein MUO19_08445, partial [Dehalococcoidales bacterium]|nr:hypothetical protein [Dehalococcoidales bacterium]
LQPNYVLSMTDEELLVKNYEGQVFRYRNPDICRIEEEVTAPLPVSGVVESLLAEADLPFETRGKTDANRISVRS